MTHLSQHQRTKISAGAFEELARGALLRAKYLTLPTIGTLQANILMIQFLPFKVQDTAFVGRLAYSVYILQLYLVGSYQNRKERDMKECDAVEIEIKRRMWWYIASTDWQVLLVSIQAPASTWI